MADILNRLAQWYQEQYLVMRVTVQVVMGLVLLTMCLWVTK
jgi:hypothetical protein